MVELSDLMYIPRQESSYTFSLNRAFKSKDYLFFLLRTGPALMTMAKFPEPIYSNFMELHSIMKRILSKNENEILTPQEILFLETKFVKWEFELGKIVNHIEFCPNTHRIGHIFRCILRCGRPFCYSMFAAETANMTSSKGVRGTQNPLPSIQRSFQLKLFYHKALKQLQEDTFFLTNFPNSAKYLFSNLFRKKNKDFRKLIKVYHKNSSEIKFRLESSSNKPNKRHCSNKMIQFNYEGEILEGRIVDIFIEEEEINSESDSVEYHEVQSFDEEVEEEEGSTEDIPDSVNENVVSSIFELVELNFREYDALKFKLKVKVGQTKKFKNKKVDLRAFEETNRVVTIHYSQVINPYAYFSKDDQTVLFKIEKD